MLGRNMILDQMERDRIKVEGSPRLLPGEFPYVSDIGYELTLFSGMPGQGVYHWIPAGESFIAQVNEDITLDLSICGIIENMQHIVEQAVTVTPYRLPGGWSGKPYVHIHNTAGTEFPIHPDMRIAVLTFDTIVGANQTEGAK